MEELLDMMVTDESPSQISDTIKDLLYAKTAARVDAYRQVVAGSTFGEPDAAIETEVETGKSTEEEE
mgnify:CR=1 FL=1|tara:strand:+ start:485 stop:685 length:201 start_codon:yes stop_codon:yes gene_type:complete